MLTYMHTYMLQCLLICDLAELLAMFRDFPPVHGGAVQIIKNVAGHQAKCTIVLGVVPKCNQHNETKG